jgi:group I intron endonuclease
MLIYLVTNLANGKLYVGQTRLTLARRWKQHVRDARNGSTTLIGRAIRKYGVDSFSLAVLCTCSSQEELDTREREHISSLGTHSSTGKGYNLTAGGFGGHHGAVGPMTGKHHSIATRERMRRAHTGIDTPHA